MDKIKYIKYFNKVKNIIFNNSNISKIKLSENTFLVKTDNTLILDLKTEYILKKGNYVIKFYHPIEMMNSLIDLSNQKLIPEIYYIDEVIFIQKYITGMNLEELLQLPKNFNRTFLEDLYKKIKFNLEKWHKLGFIHGDLNFKNILISNKEKVFLIDPFFSDKNSLSFNVYKQRDIDNLSEIKKILC